MNYTMSFQERTKLGLEQLSKQLMNKLLLFVLLLSIFICNSQNNTSKNSEKLSKYNYNLIIENKFLDGIEIESLEIGNLNLPTGKIVVCDPLANSDTIPLMKSVNPGKYPIKIFIAKTKDSGDRNALVQVEFNKNKPEKWILALREDENIEDLEEDAYFGFSVDAGLGSLMDYNTSKKFDSFQNEYFKKYPNKNIYDDFFEKEFIKNIKNKNNVNEIGSWINYTFPNTELNIVMFESGYGDGSYPVYWGMDKEGKITSLVIDFLVFNLPEAKK